MANLPQELHQELAESTPSGTWNNLYLEAILSHLITQREENISCISRYQYAVCAMTLSSIVSSCIIRKYKNPFRSLGSSADLATRYRASGTRISARFCSSSQPSLELAYLYFDRDYYSRRCIYCFYTYTYRSYMLDFTSSNVHSLRSSDMSANE